MKEIQLRRREAKSHLPPAIVTNAKKVLSSIYKGQGPLKGVTGEREKELLSELLGMDPEERGFSHASRKWWANLRVDIPSEGKVLNITTDEDDKPYNIKDYLVYKWALAHKYVAKDRQSLLKNSQKQFYIYDPDVEMQQNNKQVKIKMKAYEEFIKMKDDNSKIDLVLTVLADANPDNLSNEQKQNYMDQLIEEDPQKFLAVALDKYLEVKAQIHDLVENGVINKINSQYWFSDQLLGDNLDETVKFFRTKKNSKTVEIMRGKLEHAVKTT